MTLISVSICLCPERGVCEAVPIIEEGIGVPRGLLKAPSVDGFQPSVHAIDADVVGSNSDNWAMLLMCGMDRLVFCAMVSFPQDPERRE